MEPSNTPEHRTIGGNFSTNGIDVAALTGGGYVSVISDDGNDLNVEIFDASEDLQAVQDGYIADIFEQISENIFNDAFANW